MLVIFMTVPDALKLTTPMSFLHALMKDGTSGSSSVEGVPARYFSLSLG